MFATSMTSARLLSLLVLSCFFSSCGEAASKKASPASAEGDLSLPPLQNATALAPEFGDPEISGEGCEGLRLKLSNGAPLQGIFPEEPIAASGPRQRVQKRCLVEIPIHVPPGFRVEVGPGQVAWTGEAAMAEGATASLAWRGFFAGDQASEFASLAIGEADAPPTGTTTNAPRSETWKLSKQDPSLSSSCQGNFRPEPTEPVVSASAQVKLGLQFTMVLREGAETTSSLRPQGFTLPALIYRRCEP